MFYKCDICGLQGHFTYLGSKTVFVSFVSLHCSSHQCWYYFYCYSRVMKYSKKLKPPIHIRVIISLVCSIPLKKKKGYLFLILLFQPLMHVPYPTAAICPRPVLLLHWVRMYICDIVHTSWKMAIVLCFDLPVQQSWASHILYAFCRLLADNSHSWRHNVSTTLSWILQYFSNNLMEILQI